MALMFGEAGQPHILMRLFTGHNAKEARKSVRMGGNNPAAVHPANAVGGNVFLGFMSAVAFATILALMAALRLCGTSAVSHDIYATVIKKGQADRTREWRLSRSTTPALGLVAVVPGIAFGKRNIACMVSLAFAIAASRH